MILHIPWSANDIARAWADGVRVWEIHRSIDWNGTTGTFTLFKEVAVVEDQEEYSTTDAGEATYAYLVRGRTSGGAYTTFNGPLVVTPETELVVKAQKVLGRYVHPEGFRASWREWIPSQVRMTADGLRHGGNLPYTAGTDWTFELALLYRDSTDTDEGIDLSGVTEVLLEVLNAGGGVVATRSLTGTKLELLPQAVPHSEGGSRGHFLVLWDHDEIPLEQSIYNIRCDVTFPQGLVRQFEGTFEVK